MGRKTGDFVLSPPFDNSLMPDGKHLAPASGDQVTVLQPDAPEVEIEQADVHVEEHPLLHHHLRGGTEERILAVLQAHPVNRSGTHLTPHQQTGSI